MSTNPSIISHSQASTLLQRGARKLVAKAGGGTAKQEMAATLARKAAPHATRWLAGKVKSVVGYKKGGIVKKRRRRAKK